MAAELPKELLDNTFWCSLIALRREVHMNPEPGFEEVRTQQRVREILTSFAGVPETQIRTSAITGLIVDIKGTAPPRADAKIKCVALRSDLDALTMKEGNNSLPYRSKNEGVAHMCGHDGHIAGLMGAAILLQHGAAKIPSNFTVRLLFQPAEESTPPGKGGYDYEKTGGGGAVPMIMDGCLEGVDEVYGWHNWPAWPLGQLHVQPGPVMAHSCWFEIVITGRGGHGSQPHVCVDPIVCGAAVVSALQTIVSRSLISSSNAVVTVAQFHAGERNNVIPDTARLGGTIRDVDEAVFVTIKRRFNALVDGVCKGFGCTAEVTISSLYPCVMNHPGPTEAVERCAATLTGPVALKVSREGVPLMGAEDFSYYLKERPGCFFFLGTEELLLRGLSTYDGGDDTPRSNCICHGTTYDFNDNVLPRAVLMFLRIVEDRFGLQLYSQEEVLRAAFDLTARKDVENPSKRQKKE
eukprot:TRINITY_DN103706_c0_g1_i1.p1 TRINITY_DN103706_c0_g1~~TRINITY_DN103706_c0_g1_i1.p1  ORF type:complete len:489 (+),score=55.13 TRINITY_DN103706_c0_g1_i1:72-1469(+)